LFFEASAAAQAIDSLVARGLYYPSAGEFGDPGDGPPLYGCGEGFLRGIFGEIEIVEEVDQGGHDASPIIAVQPGYGR
jgi:hypothetical protein